MQKVEANYKREIGPRLYLLGSGAFSSATELKMSVPLVKDRTRTL